METNTGLAANVRRLLAHLPERRRWQAGVVLLLMLMGAVAELFTLGAVLPFLAVLANPRGTLSRPEVAWVLSSIGVKGEWESLLVITLTFAAIALAAAIMRIGLAWGSQKYVFRLGYDLSIAVYRRLLYQPYAFHVRNNSSQVLAVMTKVQMVVNGMMMPMMQALSSLIISLFIVGGLFFINPFVALASCLSFGMIYVFVYTTSRRRLRRNGKIIALTQRQRIQTVQEGIGGIRDVILDHAQPIYVQKFSRVDSALRDAQATNALIAATPRFLIEALGMILIGFLALALSGAAGGLVAAIPTLGALALGAQRLLPLLQLIYNGWVQLLSNRAAFLDVLAMLETSEPMLLPSHATVRLPFERSIMLRDLCFRYGEAGPWILDQISITIPRGSRVGVVGRTGSGKSTIMDIVMGLLPPTTGAVEVDGVPLESANWASWQTQIAHVPQHIYLSDASILENIAFGQSQREIDLGRVREAAAKADIADFIEEQPEGYDTLVGERGVRLSGGQRQRVGIARALYKRSTVLVFDEATSALDDATEASVMAAVDSLGRDLTVLMIAHRVTTLRNCDIIYRLDRGRVVAQGRYEEVLGVQSSAAPLSPLISG